MQNWNVNQEIHAKQFEIIHIARNIPLHGELMIQEDPKARAHRQMKQKTEEGEEARAYA